MSSFDNNSPKPNVAQRLTQAVEQLADLFQQRGTSHALIGGIAVSMRARVRATKDIDLLLSVPQLELPGLLEAMLERGCQFDLLNAIRDWNEGGMLAIEWSNGIRVDLLKPVIPAFEHILRRACEEKFGEHSLRVADAEGLLLLKLLAFRPVDQDDMQAILSAHPGTLDLDWIRQEARQSGTSAEHLADFDAMVREHYE